MALALLYVPAAAVAALLAGSLAVYYKYPKLLTQTVFRLQLLSCGMKPKNVVLSGSTFSYAERGSQLDGIPSLLFVHGFTSSKEAWCEVVRYLPRNIHVVSLDLPGHGGSSVSDKDVLHPMAQAHKVFQFVKLVGMDRQPFHMAGQSMGGAITGCFAAAYPELVSHVTLVCPAMITPEMSKFSKEVIKGKNQLVPDTVEEMLETMKLVSHRPLPSNRQVMQGMLEIRQEKKDFFEKLFGELSQPDSMSQLVQHAASIRTPTQIVWGEQDSVLDISGMDVLRSELKNSRHLRCDKIKDCGHVINMERPRVLANRLMEFQKETISMQNAGIPTAKI